MALNSVDLPTFGRPTTATKGLYMALSFYKRKDNRYSPAILFYKALVVFFVILVSEVVANFLFFFIFLNSQNAERNLLLIRIDADDLNVHDIADVDQVFDSHAFS